MYKQFNDLATDFLNRMLVTFPNEKKLIVYINKFEMLKMANYKKPVEMFMENMLPFGEQILNKDENFFKKDEYVNNAENISGKIGLVEHWDSLPQEIKNKIWIYIQGLYALGLKCLEK